MRAPAIVLVVFAAACGGHATAPSTPIAPSAPTSTAAAIAALEALIAAHPDDQQYVPDALLRLGGLQLDAADAALERMADTPDDVTAEAAMTTATAAAITVLARLIDSYPAYPRRDAALYLLGHARQQAGDEPGALAAYGAVAALPASTLADEARFRVGELHFDAGALDLAIADYAALVSRPGRFTALARYKLGWAQYRRGAYADAIAGFEGVLDPGLVDPMITELRPEAAEYVALCLTEPDWDGDGHDDPAPRGASTATLARIAAHLGDGASPVRRDVAERAAGALADEARDPEAAAVYRLLLATPVDAATRARLEASLARVVALGH